MTSCDKQRYNIQEFPTIRYQKFQPNRECLAMRRDGTSSLPIPRMANLSDVIPENDIHEACSDIFLDPVRARSELRPSFFIFPIYEM